MREKNHKGFMNPANKELASRLFSIYILYIPIMQITKNILRFQ
jgi:hypothetical protein